MSDPRESMRALAAAATGVDEALDQALRARERGELADLYRMLRYFLGFLDERFEPARVAAGKRFRPALCLLVAESLGVREKAFPAALAIELFHNFTLIHDDIEDSDELRRGRPTVWKLWGVNHAINAGDAQALIAAEFVAQAAIAAGTEELSRQLFAAFIEVTEGQYLDFELTAAPLGEVSVEQYLVMVEKKSGALVGVSAEVAGIAAGVSAEERRNLRTFGRQLGTAYQIADDFHSVWQSQEETGKDLHSDIREHKRAFPFLSAYKALEGADRNRLAKLYELGRQLTAAEIEEVLSLFEKTNAQEHTKAEIEKRAQEARTSARSLSVSPSVRDILVEIVDGLVA